RSGSRAVESVIDLGAPDVAIKFTNSGVIRIDGSRDFDLYLDVLTTAILLIDKPRPVLAVVVISGIAGISLLFHPSLDLLPHLEQPLLMARVFGKVMQLVRIVDNVIQLLRRTIEFGFDPFGGELIGLGLPLPRLPDRHARGELALGRIVGPGIRED